MEIKALSQKVAIIILIILRRKTFIRNNFVEDKNACSNKANFMNFNIPTSNRFDNLR